MISIRLTSDLEDSLNKISENENISKSEVIKRALSLYFEKHQTKHNPYELGIDLFGKYGSGDGKLSQNYKNILKGKLREKYSR